MPLAQCSSPCLLTSTSPKSSEFTPCKSEKTLSHYKKSRLQRDFCSIICRLTRQTSKNLSRSTEPSLIAPFHHAFRIPLLRLPKLIPLMYPNLFICHATSVLCLLQRHLLPYPHLSSSYHTARTLLSPRVVHDRSVFCRPRHCHFLAKRITSNGQKSISNMLRGFYLMGCNPNDTQMIVSCHMDDRIFNHSKA